MSTKHDPRIARRALFLSATILAVGIGSSAPAEAQGSPKAEVLVIHASTVAGAPSMDPKLANLGQLKKVPFNNYNVFKLLDTKTLPLAKSGPGLALANGYQLGLSLTSVEGKTFKIVPSLAKGGAPSVLPEVSAKAGEPFFVAGQSYQGGILIIAVTPSA